MDIECELNKEIGHYMQLKAIGSGFQVFVWSRLLFFGQQRLPLSLPPPSALEGRAPT
jgi:hypothetical protein